MVGEPKELPQLLVLILVVGIVAISCQFGVFDDENTDCELTCNFECNGIGSSSVTNTIVVLGTHQTGFGMVSTGSGLAGTSEIGYNLCNTLGLATITTIQNIKEMKWNSGELLPHKHTPHRTPPPAIYATNSYSGRGAHGGHGSRGNPKNRGGYGGKQIDSTIISSAGSATATIPTVETGAETKALIVALGELVGYRHASEQECRVCVNITGGEGGKQQQQQQHKHKKKQGKRKASISHKERFNGQNKARHSLSSHSTSIADEATIRSFQ